MQRADQKRTLKLIPYGEALKRLLGAAYIKPICYETVPIERSFGRVLAEDVTSEVDVPPTDRAVVDGYALRSEDTLGASPKSPVTLRIVGKLYPWSPSTDVHVSAGQAIYVTCGAPMPQGADAAVMIENTVPRDGKIEVRGTVRTGENIASAGEDVKKGNLILRKGDVLRPQDVGILAGIEMREVKVFRKPVAAIIATGNELFELSKRDPTRIVDNYALIVSGLISELGGVPIRLGISPDDLSEIKRKISEAVEKADIIVTIGGCSVGEKDLVPDAVNSFGEPGIIVHGIRVKPGKVTGFGVVEGKPIVMLPGLIASTLAGFYLILAPLIGLYSGLVLPVISAKTNHDLQADNRPLYRFLPVHMRRVNGTFITEPIPAGSSSLSRFIKSNGFILVPPNKTLKKGEEVNVTLFSNEEFTHFE